MVYFRFKSHCVCWTCIYRSICCVTTVKALRTVFLKFTLLLWRLRQYILLKLGCWLTSLSGITVKILLSFENGSVSYLLVIEGMVMYAGALLSSVVCISACTYSYWCSNFHWFQFLSHWWIFTWNYWGRLGNLCLENGGNEH